MAQGGWRFIAERLTGEGAGEILDQDLPIKGSSIEDVLSGHGAIKGTISPEVRRLIGEDGLPILTPWSTAIYAEHQGVIRGGCIYKDSFFKGPELQIDTIGFTGYAVDMPYTSSWYGVEVDPLDVVRHIWNHIQTQPKGNIGLQLSALKTGLKIGTELQQVEFDTVSGPVSFEAGPVKLAWYQTHDLAGEIDTLAEENSFDYHERHYYDSNGVIRHALDFGYPKIGKRQENLRFVVGENVFENPAIDFEGDIYASEALVLGAGEGAAMIKGTASRPSPNRLRRVAVVSDSSLRSKKAVNSAAAAELAWRNNLDSVSEIFVRSTPHARLGSYSVGDEIRLQGELDWVDLDMWVRILSITLEPEAGDGAMLSVTPVNRLAG